MSKALQKILIYILAASFVFAGYWQVFAIEKASAQSPPSPGTPRVGIAFGSTERQSLLVKYYPAHSETPRDYNFDNGGAVVNNPSGPIDDNAVVNTADQVKDQFDASDWQKVASIGVTQNFWFYYLNSDHDYKLMVAQKSGSRDYFNCGLYKKSGSKYKMIGMQLIIFLPGGNQATEDVGQFLNTTALGQKVQWYISTEQACTQLKTRWLELVGYMKDIIGKNPADNSEYWGKDSPPGWQQAVTVSTINSGLFPVTGFASGFLSEGLTILVNKWRNYDGTYMLNNAGMEKAVQIRGLASDLIAIGNQLKGERDVWPNNECRPAKVNENLELLSSDFFDKPSTFIAFAEALLNFFNEMVKKLTGTTDDVCGSALTNYKQIFGWMFCKIADITHSFARWLMTRAFNWLEASIGIETIKFKKPILDLENLGK